MARGCPPGRARGVVDADWKIRSWLRFYKSITILIRLYDTHCFVFQCSVLLASSNSPVVVYVCGYIHRQDRKTGLKVPDHKHKILL